MPWIIQTFLPISRTRSIVWALWCALSLAISLPVAASDGSTEDFTPSLLRVEDLTPQEFSALASLAAAASVSTGNITNDVASILDLLSSVMISLGSSKAVETYPMSTTRQTMGTTIGNALFESFNATTGGTAANSLLKEMQRALWGVQGSPANHDALIAGLLENLRDKAMTNDLSSIEQKLSTANTYLSGISSPLSSINTSVGDISYLLSQWNSYLTNPDHDAWMVELDDDSLAAVEGYFHDQTSSLLNSISNAVQAINTAAGSNSHDLFEVISSIVDRIDDNFGGYDDHATYIQNALRQLLAGISSVAVSSSNMVGSLDDMSLDIDLSPVVDAIIQTDTHLEQLRTQSLGYPSGSSQYLLLTNLLANSVSIRDWSATNALSSESLLSIASFWVSNNIVDTNSLNDFVAQDTSSDEQVHTNSAPEFSITLPSAPSLDPFSDPLDTLQDALPYSQSGSPQIVVVPAMTFGGVSVSQGVGDLSAISTGSFSWFVRGFMVWAWRFVAFILVFFIVRGEWNYWTTLGGSASE